MTLSIINKWSLSEWINIYPFIHSFWDILLTENYCLYFIQNQCETCSAKTCVGNSAQLLNQQTSAQYLVHWLCLCFICSFGWHLEWGWLNNWICARYVPNNCVLKVSLKSIQGFKYSAVQTNPHKHYSFTFGCGLWK